ncbi:sulfultransferase [Corynebacterium atypicum]|uniref:thiosulfate sulfurtransferase n=1 Tax=Corynebacterium atypicum TaxID=191610 RepID=A0ABN4DEI6_9CORY|nr:rhodanese-like domain-containing protein [Corynebacterium atypicum]AIG64730.1 sulfultransferase [Corynebacterium atypicum]
MRTFITTEQLAADLDQGKKTTMIAVFWGPGDGDGYRKFVSEHIPTSVFCDPARALAGVPELYLGRNPLPDHTRLQNWIQNWGVDESSNVVVYDEGRGLFAARAWWTLRWAGLTNIRILDGGMAKWLAEERPYIGGPGNLFKFSGFEVRPGAVPVLTLEQMREFDGLLIDAREERRWAGRRELLDLRAGHIPGAVNIPVRSLLHDDHTVRSMDEVREIFAGVGIVNPADAAAAATYSGSGNHSAQLLAVMAEAGLEGTAHYVGGWSQWTHHRLPVKSEV